MPISSETTRAPYDGDGSTTEFAITFEYESNEDNLRVILRTIATGVESVLTKTTNYTVNTTTDIVMTVTTYGTAYQIIIERAIPYTQPTDWVDGERYGVGQLEDALDRLTMLLGQHEDMLGRGLIGPPGDDMDIDMTMPSDVERASHWLAFNTSGAPIAAAANTPSAATVTTWARTLLDDTTRLAALVTLLGNIYTVSGDYTVLDDDGYLAVVMSNATLTLPTAAANMGRILFVISEVMHAVPTVVPETGEVIKNKIGNKAKGQAMGFAPLGASLWATIFETMGHQEYIKISTGDWNMDTLSQFTIYFSNMDISFPTTTWFFPCECMIKDDGNLWTPLSKDGYLQIENSSLATITLYRTSTGAGGIFDAATYTMSAGFLRGILKLGWLE